MVDVILDTVGAKYLGENLKAAAPEGASWSSDCSVASRRSCRSACWWPSD